MKQLRRKLSILALMALVTLMICVAVQGDVPHTVSYQGFLSLSSGETAPDGSYNLAFALYTSSSGGSPVWQENHLGVDVYQGRFDVILGSQFSLAGVSFDQPYWLGISVNGGTELPRMALTSSAYSLNTRSIVDNAVTGAKIQDGSISNADISNSASISATKLNDGAGSGLDADLLDGQQASAFILTGQTNSITSGMIVDETIQQGDLGFSAGDITGVIAGAGLSGGGSSDEVTLAVGSGTGIQVLTNFIELTSAYSTGSAYDSRFVNEGQLNSVTGGMIANGTIQFADIGQNSAGSGQVMKWNGSAWAAANDNTGSGVTDHGALTGLGDDDHPQYLKVTRTTYGAEFRGHFEIFQNSGQRLMDFQDEGGARVGYFTIRDGDNLQLFADDASLYISSDLDIICTNSDATGTIPIYASAFIVSSPRGTRTEVRYLTERDCQKALVDISTMKPATYQIRGAAGDKTQLGLMAEEVPSELLAPRGDAVDLYALTTSLVAAVKALKAQVEQQAEIIEELRGQ